MTDAAPTAPLPDDPARHRWFLIWMSAVALVFVAAIAWGLASLPEATRAGTVGVVVAVFAVLVAAYVIVDRWRSRASAAALEAQRAGGGPAIIATADSIRARDLRTLRDRLESTERARGNGTGFVGPQLISTDRAGIRIAQPAAVVDRGSLTLPWFLVGGVSAEQIEVSKRRSRAGLVIDVTADAKRGIPAHRIEMVVEGSGGLGLITAEDVIALRVTADALDRRRQGR